MAADNPNSNPNATRNVQQLEPPIPLPLLVVLDDGVAAIDAQVAWNEPEISEDRTQLKISLEVKYQLIAAPVEGN